MKWTDGAIDGVVIRPIVKHEDTRGWVTELYRADETQPDVMPVMTYVSVTKPGVARGPHAHVRQTDTFGFLGPGTFRLYLWDNRKGSPTFGKKQTVLVGENNKVIVVIPPGIVHGYRNVAKSDAWVINLPNRLYAGAGRREPVDDIRYENQAGGQFRMEDRA